MMDDKSRIAIIDIVPGDDQLLRYQYSNNLSTAALELDYEADIISYEEYYPYGNTSFQAGRTTTEVSLKRYRYIGKERDEETGLYYMGARYYMPWVGRWIAVDPLESKYSPESPYNYCHNNPIIWNDKTGMGPIDDGLPSTREKSTSQPAPQFGSVQIPGASRVAADKTYVQPAAPSAAQPIPKTSTLPRPKGSVDNTGTAGVHAQAKLHEQAATMPIVIHTGHISNDQTRLMAPAEQRQHEEIRVSINQELGYNANGDPTFIKKLEQSKGFSGFAQNLAIPAINLALAADGLGGVADLGISLAAKGTVEATAEGESINLYRAVSQSELNDVNINGIRNSSGYETGKLFATSPEDAANFGKINFKLDEKPFTIMKTSISNEYEHLLYKGEMDLMQGVSVPNNLFNQLSKPSILNYSPLPNHPFIR